MSPSTTNNEPPTTDSAPQVQSRRSRGAIPASERAHSEQQSGRVLPEWVAASTEDAEDIPWFSAQDPRADEAREDLPALLDAGSLTATLRNLSDGSFAVELLEEGWSACSRSSFIERFAEAAAISRFWSRKVVLQGGGEDWVIAHTLIPEASLSGAIGEVLSLGSKPLGEWLFSQAALQRSEIELCRIDSSTWGRRSWFTLQGQDLLVVEFFLPALLSRASAK